MACASAGISASTFLVWKGVVLPKALEKIESGIPLTAHEKNVFKLLRDVEREEANFEMDMVEVIVDGSSRDPNHAKWLLERRAGERWGGRNVVNVEHTGKIDSENVVTVEIGAHISSALQSLEKFNDILNDTTNDVDKIDYESDDETSEVEDV